MDLIGGLIKGMRGLVRNETGGAEQDGQIIDRRNYESLSLLLGTGVDTGGATNIQIQYRITQSDASDMTGETDLVALTQWLNGNSAAVASKELEVSVDLSGAKRYIRASQTVTFTGGTTPAIPLALMVALGGAKVLPAV